MDDTGRIKRALTPEARLIVFGGPAGPREAAELAHITQVDRAHLVMLAQRGIVSDQVATNLLGAIQELRASGFAALMGRHMPRGIFLLYENYLIETCDAGTGGILQTARSRNDLNATVLKRRLRGPYLKLMRGALRLQVTLMRLARRYRDVLMPYYTHGQAAVPGTYGHYLAGHALALAGHLEVLTHWTRELDVSPLGAGSVGGTNIEIDTQLTAQLLGFERGPAHSVEAVASRDYLLRLSATLAILGVSLSRLAADLTQWCTAEFGFLSLPDELVGSSSAMPQKRNPYLLEHVKGRCASAVGSFVSAATAMHNTPFTNSIAVNTEGASHIWEALEQVTEAGALLRIMIRGAKPQPQRMRERAEKGFTSALALANHLANSPGRDFRAAHKLVGELVNQAVESGLTLEEAAQRVLPNDDRAVADLEPASVALSCNWGGGPGLESLDACLSQLRGQSRDLLRSVRCRLEAWRAADERLDVVVAQLSRSDSGK